MTWPLMKDGLQNLSFIWLVLLEKLKTAYHEGRNCSVWFAHISQVTVR